MAKAEIKTLFGIDIEVDFVKTENVRKRKTELAKLYNKELDDPKIGNGLFLHAEGENKPIILVGYSDDSPEYIVYSTTSCNTSSIITERKRALAKKRLRN